MMNLPPVNKRERIKEPLELQRWRREAIEGTQQEFLSIHLSMYAQFFQNGCLAACSFLFLKIEAQASEWVQQTTWTTTTTENETLFDFLCFHCGLISRRPVHLRHPSVRSSAGFPDRPTDRLAGLLVIRYHTTRHFGHQVLDKRQPASCQLPKLQPLRWSPFNATHSSLPLYLLCLARSSPRRFLFLPILCLPIVNKQKSNVLSLTFTLLSPSLRTICSLVLSFVRSFKWHLFLTLESSSSMSPCYLHRHFFFFPLSLSLSRSLRERLSTANERTKELRDHHLN